MASLFVDVAELHLGIPIMNYCQVLLELCFHFPHPLPPPPPKKKGEEKGTASSKEWPLVHGLYQMTGTASKV